MDGGVGTVTVKADSDALEMDWSPDRAKGHADGIAYRMRDTQPSKYLLVGIDEYALGFRAGYYDRQEGKAGQEK